MYKGNLCEIGEHDRDFSRLYTDRSRLGDQVAVAVVYGTVTKCRITTEIKCFS